MKWDLTRLYSTLEDWEKDVKEIEDSIGKAAAYQGKLGEYEVFLDYYNNQKELSVKIMKAYQYAALTYDLNRKNTENGARVQRMGNILSRIGQATAFEQPELLALGKEKIDSFIKKSDTLKEYAFSIEKLFHSQEHVLDEKSEKLMANYSQLRGQGSEIYSALSVSDKVDQEIELFSGEKITVTSGNFRSYLADLENDIDRRDVFEAVFSNYEKNKNTYAQIYNTVLQRDVATMKNRGYNSSLESYLHGNNIPTEVYKNLVEVAESTTDLIKRYYEIRRNALNLEKHHTYDRFIPLAESTSKYSYDEAIELFLASIDGLDNEFVQKAKSAIEEGYIDVFEQEGKQTGAYSWGALNEHPFILLNYDETLSDVFTLAHEAGHSMHSLFSAESQPVATQNYTIFVAEVASTFNEHNLLDYFIKSRNTSKDDKITLLQQSIDDILGTFYRQTLFASYELRAHELAEQGVPITFEALSQIMIDLYKKYYDIDISEEGSKQFVWAYIPHLFYTPFYVYQYATSFAASLKLYEMVKEDSANIKHHMNLLKSGGSDFPVELVKKAGVDLTTKEPFKAVANRLESLLDELELALKE